MDDLQPAAALPVIEEALARYSTLRRRGFKGGKDGPRLPPPVEEK